jgi:hypothetical protein
VGLCLGLRLHDIGEEDEHSDSMDGDKRTEACRGGIMYLDGIDHPTLLDSKKRIQICKVRSVKCVLCRCQRYP